MKLIILLLSFAVTLSLFGKVDVKAKKVELKKDTKKVEHKKDAHHGHAKEATTTKKINFVREEGVVTHHNEKLKPERILPFVDAKYNSTIIKGGQIFSSLKVSESHMNIKDKAKKTHAFDIHATKNVGCAKCHTSTPTNNKPTDYLNRLNIILDKGSVDNYLGLKHSSVKDFKVKSCIACHEGDMAKHAKWLPATAAHMKTISCETCHINKKDMFTAQSFNYGLVDNNAEPFISFIGKNEKDEITGFTSDLIWFKGKTDKNIKLKAAKMVSFIVWIDKAKGDKAFIDNNLLKTAIYSGTTLKPEVLKAFDKNNDKKLSAKESQIDSDAKKAVLVTLLKQAGVKDPELKLISIPIALEHNVMAKEMATKSCESCHNKKDNSILYNKMTVLDYKLATNNMDIVIPGVKDTKLAKFVNGKIVLDKEKLPKDHFMMITDTATNFDMIFIYLLIATILALLGHGLLRVMFASKRNNK